MNSWGQPIKNIYNCVIYYRQYLLLCYKNLLLLRRKSNSLELRFIYLPWEQLHYLFLIPDMLICDIPTVYGNYSCFGKSTVNKTTLLYQVKMLQGPYPLSLISYLISAIFYSSRAKQLLSIDIPNLEFMNDELMNTVFL